ncbi:MAG TPA: glycosyltransferase family 4 protein [Anaerolineae bacterium]|nr:glycosyltransferase family 4 protein [Anaerolineae bacterium]
MPPSLTAFVHYTAPPIIGGVEAVMHAHAQAFLEAGYPVEVIAGRGAQAALPPGTNFKLLPVLDSLHSDVSRFNDQLAKGEVPPTFDEMVATLAEELAPLLSPFDYLIVHNIFTKHFHLPLTAALHQLLDKGKLNQCIAWCHDFTWGSPNSGHTVHPGYPWDLLRTYRPDVTYVVVSQERQRTLAQLFKRSNDDIHVIHNGVDPAALLGLSETGRALAERFGLWEADLVLLMPVRVTQAKNIEYALHVTAALKRQGSQPRLIVTGPPDPHDAASMDYFQTLRALRQELDLKQEAHFVFECGPDPETPYFLDYSVVSELLRSCDVMLMPSHREGFGMPILEAGLLGRLVVCTAMPAALEIGGQDVMLFEPITAPAQVANQILTWSEANSLQRLRRRVRQGYTWSAIFHRQIEPLLKGKRS